MISFRDISCRFRCLRTCQYQSWFRDCWPTNLGINGGLNFSYSCNPFTNTASTNPCYWDARYSAEGSRLCRRTGYVFIFGFLYITFYHYSRLRSSWPRLNGNWMVATANRNASSCKRTILLIDLYAIGIIDDIYALLVIWSTSSIVSVSRNAAWYGPTIVDPGLEDIKVITSLEEWVNSLNLLSTNNQHRIK